MLNEHETSHPKGTGAAFLLGTLVAVATVILACATQKTRTESLTSFEPEIQKIAEARLRAAIEKHGARAGLIAVSEPSTGKILAAAVIDPKNSLGDSRDALSYRLEPASLVKTLVAAKAIDQGLTTITEKHDGHNGSYDVGGKHFSDWKPFSKISTLEVISMSSNIGGIALAEKLGTGNLTAALQDFGWTSFPPAEDVGDELFVAMIGSGYNGPQVTPLEVIQAYGAIANGGNLMKPLAYDSTESPQVVRRVISEKSAATTKQMLREVVLHGTAKGARSHKFTFAGKTATGYHPLSGAHPSLGGTANVASFVGMAPLNEPKVAVYASVIFAPRETNVHGSAHAAPLVREVTEDVLTYWKTNPDETR